MADAAAAREAEFVLDPANVAPSRAGALRYLGYPKSADPGSLISARLDEALERCAGAIHARGIYSVHPIIGLTADSIAFEGGLRMRGDIGDFLAGARRAAAFAVTAGSEITALAESAARARDSLSALVYGAIGSDVAEAALAQLLTNLRRTLPPGESLTLPYSPGYCGIPVSQLQTVLRLVPADRIGVHLLPTRALKPVKSISGLVGIGPEAEVKIYGNTCDRCPNTDCEMRRESAD